MILETQRLILRPFQLKDLTAFHAYRNDPSCARYQKWEETTLEELRLFIYKNQYRTLEDPKVQLALADKTNNELIGDLFIARKSGVITLGFTISPSFRRQGYMFEALSAFLPYLREKFPQDEVICLVHPQNIPSKRLLETLNFEKKDKIKFFDSELFMFKK